jgi:hypothetical protein
MGVVRPAKHALHSWRGGARRRIERGQLMAGIIVGWISGVAVLFIAITRPWRSAAARAPAPLILATAAAAWCLWDGATIYQDQIAEGAWTGATLLIPYVPVKALAYAVLAYAVGRTALAARTQDAPNRYVLPAILAVVLLVAVGDDIRMSVDAVKIRAARSQTLTPPQIAAIVARIDGKTAVDAEIGAFMQNPLCPPDLLQRQADTAPAYREYIARNPNIPADLLVKLSKDATPSVRYSAATNPNLPASELPRMATDTDATVREMVTWKKELPDESFLLLLDDPEPRVRSTAAVQPRISDAALLRLTEDADPSVRSNAVRIAVQRGLKE